MHYPGIHLETREHLEIQMWHLLNTSNFGYPRLFCGDLKKTVLGSASHGERGYDWARGHQWNAAAGPSHRLPQHAGGSLFPAQRCQARSGHMGNGSWQARNHVSLFVYFNVQASCPCVLHRTTNIYFGTVSKTLRILIPDMGRVGRHCGLCRQFINGCCSWQ